MEPPLQSSTNHALIHQYLFWLTVGEELLQSRVNPKIAIIFNETTIPKAIHKKTDARPSCADHLRKCFLVHLEKDWRRRSILPKAGQRQQDSGQPHLAGAEYLVNEFILDSRDAMNKMRNKDLCECRLTMNAASDTCTRDPADAGGLERCGRRRPQRLSRQAPFTEEIAVVENGKDRLLPALRRGCQLHVPASDKEQRIGFITLKVDRLLVKILTSGCP